MDSTSWTSCKMAPGIRLKWLDWMKALGMLAIVYGHLFSYGALYFYAFSVPVFFVISGFLFKEGQEASVFWGKLWRQLIVPMLLISLVSNVYLLLNSVRHHDLDTARLFFPLGILSGEYQYLGICWFIYTLALVRILSWLVKQPWMRLGLAVAFLVAAFFLSPLLQGKEVENAIPVVLLAYPFFLAGQWFRKSGWTSSEVPWWVCLLAIAALTALLVLIARANDYVFVYRFIFGNNLLLYLAGGLVGTGILYFLSRLMKGFASGWIETIAKGSILILGFHQYILLLYRYFFDQNPFDILAAVGVVLLFIPLIRLCSKYFPALIGGR